LFGDDWNLRFCALILVGALFIFGGKNYEKTFIDHPYYLYAIVFCCL